MISIISRVLLALLIFHAIESEAQIHSNLTPKILQIRRIDDAPVLEDFLDMEPDSQIEKSLTKVEGFIQRVPSDGSPSSRRTVVYLGYDSSHFYAVFLCFDPEPEKIRARMFNRGSEIILSDDVVTLQLDTFHDKRQAYVFGSNPLGVQSDWVWVEGRGFDQSYDAVFQTKGQLTDRGYVVWMAIPFTTLRFPSKPNQEWGVLLTRDIPRLNEETFWPHYCSHIEGRLNQIADLTGLEQITSGKNTQLIPYASARSFRALDQRPDVTPHFIDSRLDPELGLDTKLIINDSLVLDLTLNPDFSQVESDEPQVTVNERFEVFFPEKRQFFLENASSFQTPMNLLFTRRIADPQIGARLTGKIGKYAIGALSVNDESPGKNVAEHHPISGDKAIFSVFRISRDILEGSNLGILFTDREFESSFNRVAGIDGRLKLNSNWAGSFQAVTSVTQLLDGRHLSGPAYQLDLLRSGRKLSYEFIYAGISPDFRTQSGFVERTDIHSFHQSATYSFRPEGKHLINWGPALFTDYILDYSGKRLDWVFNPHFLMEFTGQTLISLRYAAFREKLRAVDFPVLAKDQDFSHHQFAASFATQLIPQFSVNAFGFHGSKVNFNPAEGTIPFLGQTTHLELTLTLRPGRSLTVDHTYLLTDMNQRKTGVPIFTDHILRSRWSYQFSRELSMRVILQYNALLTNPELTDLPTIKSLNADFLLTYLIHPGTALYIGYNSNLENLHPDLIRSSTGLVRTRNSFINNGRQFFVKYSYLLRL
ncbi:carbohydrate binding family 9 domain-containing protein [bacterium]|nr:carbohydrate binding family 9 domain-containing protein [bacterium]